MHNEYVSQNTNYACTRKCHIDFQSDYTFYIIISYIVIDLNKTYLLAMN